MEKKQLLQELPHKRVYATEEPLIRWVEYTGEHAEFHASMSCYLMNGMRENEVNCNFIERLSETEHAELKILEIPMVLTVLDPKVESYAYYVLDGDKRVPMTRDELLESKVLIRDALNNIEDIGEHVCKLLDEYFEQHNIRLGAVDFTFGHVMEHFIVMGGDLTPDTMCLYDPETGKRLWNGEDGMENAYEIIMQRIRGGV